VLWMPYFFWLESLLISIRIRSALS
jgi:hypothetical protein